MIYFNILRYLKAQHCQAIDFLQKQLVEARNETERLGKQVEELNKSVNNSKSTPNDDVISNLSSRSRNENFYKANPLLIKVDDNLEVISNFKRLFYTQLLSIKLKK